MLEMTLLFSDICKLLDTLYDQCIAGKPDQNRNTIQRWFAYHRDLINSLDTSTGAALLSTLLPARRTDRVYYIQETRLEKIFARSQRLGASRVRELCRYKVPGSGVDLADCIYTSLKATVRGAELSPSTGRRENKKKLLPPRQSRGTHG